MSPRSGPAAALRTVLVAAALASPLGAEAPSPAAGAPTPAPAALEWPLPPAAPRLRYVASITGLPRKAKASGVAKLLRFLLGVDWSGPGRARPLVRPTGLFARDGVVYVADPGAEGVFRYDEAAGKGRWLDAGRRPKLVSPVAVAVADDGRVFVADSALGSVAILDKDGKRIGELRGDPEGMGRPVGLALAPDRLFVSDVDRHRVSAYDLKGLFLYSFGHRGSAGDDLNFPTYLWYDAPTKRLWVCDSGNFRLRSFDPEGRPLDAFGENGDRPGYLARPRGLALDSEGHVYSMDGALEAMQVFDSRGRLLLFLGEEGAQAGEFALPGGVFVDGADRVLVADTYNGRVEIFQYLKAPRSDKENGS